jgi:hypothetical protein
MITISPSEVKNADSVPPVYSNNIQIQGGGNDVWLLFNVVVPNGDQYTVERKASVVMTITQFFIFAQMLSENAKAIMEVMAKQGGVPGILTQKTSVPQE